MNGKSVIDLLVLSSIWGSSFLFMRVGAPVVGPTMLIILRVGLAALFLLMVGLALKKQLHLKQHWQHYVILGALNSAIPFLMFAYAAQTISASLLSIMNATAPIWGALFTVIWERKAIAKKTVFGLLLGVIGVSTLVGFDHSMSQQGAVLAMLAALGAAGFYGSASLYARHARHKGKNPPDAFGNAHGSMWTSTIMLLPVLFFFPMREVPSTTVMGAIFMLGVLCSGVALLIYFRLIANVGATSALTVTFLIPLFGVFWGHTLLGEPIGWPYIDWSVNGAHGHSSCDRLSSQPTLSQAGSS